MLPANFFSQAATPPTAAPSTLPADFFSGKQTAPATLPATFFSQPPHDPNSRFFSGSGQATISAYQPSIWDRIRNVVTAGIPRYSSRTVNNPKYGEMQLLSPEEALTPSEQKAHPIATGVGEIAGGLTSPQSVALLAGTAGLGELPGAAAMLPRLMSAGFGAQAIYAAYKNVPAIREAWNRGDASEVERLLTHTVLNLAMGAAAGQHAATGAGAVTGKVNEAPAEPVETHGIEPTSPVGEVLAEHAPSVRVADSAAAARDVLESETIARPEAAVRGPNGPEFRNTARVVADDHIPVVSRDAILAEGIQNIVNNSAELRRAGVDTSAIKTTGDVDAVLERASDHVKSNLDPRASATISFEAQKQLAADLGMTVEDLLSRRGGQAFNTEQAIAARALLNESAKNVVRLSQIAAQTGDNAALNDATTALAQHQAIQEKVAGITAEAGRALGGFRIGDASLPQVKIANVLSKLKPAAQAEAVRLMSKLDANDPATVRTLNEFAEKIKPSTPLDKLFEYYRSSLLSSPHTIIVKTASEAAMAAMTAMQKAIAGGIGKFTDSPDRYAAEGWYYAKGMAQALAERAKPILSGEFQLEGSPGFERVGQQAIKGKIGSAVRAPSEAMSRMTNLVYAGNYFGELSSLAARAALSEGLEGDAFHARQEYLAHHPTDEMTEAAHQLATTNTFQNELTGVAAKIGQAIAAKPDAPWLPESLKGVSPLRFLFPFYKTPINLVKASPHPRWCCEYRGDHRSNDPATADRIAGDSIPHSRLNPSSAADHRHHRPTRPASSLESRRCKPIPIHDGATRSRSR